MITKRVWAFLFYVFYFAAASGLYPFIALYYHDIGLSGTWIGLLTGLVPMIALIGAPFWTGLADASHRHKLILNITLAATIVSALLIPASESYVLLVLVVLVYWFCVAPIPSMGDSATLSMLGDQRRMYGRIRIGGSIGWGLMAYGAGVLVDQNGIGSIFGIYAIGMLLTLFVSQGLTFEKAKKQESFWHDVGKLLTNRRWLLFLGMAFVSGIGLASISIYQFVYMAEIGASGRLMGLSLTIATLSELPVMYFGHLLLKRFKAHGLLMLGMVAIGIRALLYAAFNHPNAILLFQLLHGLTFPAIWIAGVSYAHQSAPGGLIATAQGLFGSMLMGFGSGAGGFLGGILIERLGGRGMYLVFGVLVLISLILFRLFEKFVPLYHEQTI